MKWATPKKRGSGFFVVPRPKHESAWTPKNPAFGDFNAPLVEQDANEDENETVSCPLNEPEKKQQ